MLNGGASFQFRRAPGELPDVSTEASQSPNDGVKDLGRTDENDPIVTISRLQVLPDHIGQSYKILRACVDTLVKSPAIAPQDKGSFQR